jgi:hypothetical protein
MPRIRAAHLRLQGRELPHDLAKVIGVVQGAESPAQPKELLEHQRSRKHSRKKRPRPGRGGGGIACGYSDP